MAIIDARSPLCVMHNYQLLMFNKLSINDWYADHESMEGIYKKRNVDKHKKYTSIALVMAIIVILIL